MKLFTVGPVEMEENVKACGGIQIPYFRTPEFSDMMRNIEYNFKSLANAPENAKLVVLTASGTGAMEAAVSNILNRNDKILVINGGSFGHRFVQLCQCFHLRYEELRLAYGEILTMEKLVPFQKKGFTALLVNLHETSTGQLYDGQLLADFCRAEHMLFIIDAISTLFADPFDMDALGADAVICSSQKALALPPGLSFILMNERVLERVQSSTPPSMYFNLKDYLKNMERGQTPYTPAVGIIIQLAEQLKHMADIGIWQITQIHQGRAEYFRKQCMLNGIKTASFPQSNALTTVEFEKDNAYEIFLRLKDEYQLMLTPSGGDLANRILRVGHLGNLNFSDFDEVIRCLREVM